nr:hypothetical protein [Leuconostoc mesenteroides]
MNADTDKILSEKNAHKPLAIASISKLMTGYLVLKKLPLGTQVQPSSNTMKIGEESNLASVNLVSNQSYSADELLRAALQLSANDAAIALGDQVSGSQTKFVKLMTKTSQSWDLHQRNGIMQQESVMMKQWMMTLRRLIMQKIRCLLLMLRL